MARSDLILSVVRSAKAGDRRSFERSVKALIAEERAKSHGVFAGKLEEELRNANGTGGGLNGVSRSLSNSAPASLWTEWEPKRELGTLVLPEHVRGAVRELCEEQQRADLLRSHGVEPRHRVLLTGPPGNGKTSLAEAIADALMLPVISPRYESLIGSYQGETASRLAKLFEYARSRQCVLFFDEFDTLGRERGDQNETGEIKRVASSLLLQVDALPSYVVTVVATNHPETLDRAVWRRFQLRLDLPAPNLAAAGRWFEAWAKQHGEKLPLAPRTLAEGVRAESYAELEGFCDDVRRRIILQGPDCDRKAVCRERVAQWKARVKASRTT